ncbi:hypothetical protein J31TS4_33110 [Paenibacillus sp. J31TS4]|uniref:DUF948 domain-containing protein n=1 Tax=Paenibacillus sp. J31TS4 TaxID=2807195 RepID=UPI001B254AB4|nr:DUF948 domain-containing protein [Paenibacillus sp. J31TS4]GIP40031.1 hypothetical protein J31TS4_33110 [Paenibacillus sp. J31TS4]
MIWQIGVLIIALAFAALVFFLIKTLRTVETSLQQTNETITQLKDDLNDVSGEVKGLLRSTNQITMDIRGKMRSLDSLFGTVENVGDTLEGVTSSIKTASQSFMTNVRHNNQLVEAAPPNKKVYKAINWFSSLYDIWQRIKIHRMTDDARARH